MSLTVPIEMIKEINPHSGFINMKSRFGGKTVKGLWYTNENRSYLIDQLYSLLTNSDFVQDTIQAVDTNSKPMDLVKQFKPIKPVLGQRIQVLIEAWKLPYREDHSIHNPVMELSNINCEFLTTTAATIIQSPDCVLKGYYNHDPNTGKHDDPEWEYGAASWADGTWHPEHLFTQSKRNEANPYWVPVSVTFDTNPPPGDDASIYGDRPTAFHPRAQHYNPSRANVTQPTPRQKNVASGLGRREQFVPTQDRLPMTRPTLAAANRIDPKYVDIPNIQDLLLESSYPYDGNDSFSKTYHTQEQVYAPGPGPGNRYRYDFYGDRGFSTGGTFPRWQTSVNDRPYERNVSEGLRAGGTDDRRTQRPSGYNMSALTTKSSY